MLGAAEVIEVTEASSTALWIAAAGATATTVAALAAFWNTRLTRHLASAARQPHLIGEIGVHAGRPILTITNAGPGPAPGVGFGVIEDKEGCAGPIWPNTYLAPNDKASVELNFTSVDPDRDAADNFGYVMCRDIEGFPHCWSLQGEHRVFQRFSIRRLRRVPDYKNPNQVIRSFYGNRPLLEGLDDFADVGYTPLADPISPPSGAVASQ